MFRKIKPFIARATLQKLSISLFVSLNLTSICYGQEKYDDGRWQSLMAQVNFQIEIVDIGNRSIGENEIRSSKISERTVYTWNPARNEIVSTVFARPNEYAKMIGGEPFSSYEWKWNIGIAIKQFFMIQEEVKLVLNKIEVNKNNAQLGADYMIELANLFDQLLEIKVPNVLVLKTTDQFKTENLHKLINDLIVNIGDYVIQSRSSKTEFVYNSFWKSLQYKSTAQSYFNQAKKMTMFSRTSRDNKIASEVFQSTAAKYQTEYLSQHYADYIIKNMQCDILFSN